MPDTTAFPCLALAYQALRGAPSLPVALNAANEVAVERFLEGRLAFTAIGRLIEATLSARGQVTSTCRGVFVAVKEGHPAFHRW